MKRGEHPPVDPLALISNPALTGILVHPLLIEQRSYDEKLWFHLAHLNTRHFGSKICIRDLLLALKDPMAPCNSWQITIPIHPSLADGRMALMTEQDFIHSGEVAIYKHGVEKYFQHVMEHLAQGVLA